MALHGNRSVLHKSPVRFLNGGAAILRNNFGKHGMVRNSYEVFAATAAIPYGYYGGRGAWVQPKKGGAVSGVNAIALTLGASGAGSMGVNTSGTASITFDLTGVGGLISSASGVASISLSASGNIFAAKYTSGSAGITLGATGTVKAIGHTGGTAGMTLGASWTPYAVGWVSGTTAEAGLTPTGIASAVWGSTAASYNAAGTMGEKLNGAGSAGNPWTEVIESGLTAAEVLRILAAAMAGSSQKTGSTIVFKGMDGTTDRITGSFDAEGNRTGVIVDGA